MSLISEKNNRNQANGNYDLDTTNEMNSPLIQKHTKQFDTYLSGNQKVTTSSNNNGVKYPSRQDLLRSLGDDRPSEHKKSVMNTFTTTSNDN